MPKSFFCEGCDYKTSKKSSYNNHLKSKKHKNNVKLLSEIDVPKNTVQKNCTEVQESCTESCDFCGKTYTEIKYLNRHKKTCSKKDVYEMKLLLEKKEKKEKKLKEELEELKEVQSDYQDLLKQIAKSKTSPQTINLHYVVNNFTEALNYEDLMTPKLTDAEADEVRELEPIAGTINIIKKRCITGMDVKKRPLHCLDTSRNKYLVRTENEWRVDHYAKRIFKDAAKHIHDMYATNPAKSNLPIEQIMRNQQKLLKLESKSSKNKMIKDLNDKVYIKNIKIESVTKN